jgi:hypothetical protein
MSEELPYYLKRISGKLYDMRSTVNEYLGTLKIGEKDKEKVRAEMNNLRYKLRPEYHAIYGAVYYMTLYTSELVWKHVDICVRNKTDIMDCDNCLGCAYTIDVEREEYRKSYRKDFIGYKEKIY